MTKINKLFIFWGVTTPLLMLGFMNCSQFVASDSASVPSSMGVIQSVVERQNFTVQSAAQLAQSMASVTGVEYVNSIVSEYNSRRALMTTDYSFESVTAPMMISIANLGSQYCNELIRVESAKAAAERQIFASVDFSKGVGTLEDAHFENVLSLMSHKFWGRELSAEERGILNDARREFIQAIPSGSANAAAQTRALMLSTCTGMLASLEFITI